jgi:hypothetical protein
VVHFDDHEALEDVTVDFPSAADARSMLNAAWGPGEDIVDARGNHWVVWRDRSAEIEAYLGTGQPVAANTEKTTPPTAYLRFSRLPELPATR